MSEKSRARKAFDACPNRYVGKINLDNAKLFGTRTDFKCAKYPETRQFAISDLDSRSERGKLSFMLGCETCPYKDEEYVEQRQESVRIDGVIETVIDFVPKEPIEPVPLDEQ